MISLGVIVGSPNFAYSGNAKHVYPDGFESTKDWLEHHFVQRIVAVEGRPLFKISVRDSDRVLHEVRVLHSMKHIFCMQYQVMAKHYMLLHLHTI